MPVRFSLEIRLMLSVSLWTLRTLGRTMMMIKAITARRAATNPAVMAERVQLFPIIFTMAQTAMMGERTMIWSPMATSIWIWVMSLVFLVIRLGTENRCISSWPKSATLLNTSSRRQ